jgi:hypothetical protein
MPIDFTEEQELGRFDTSLIPGERFPTRYLGTSSLVDDIMHNR